MTQNAGQLLKTAVKKYSSVMSLLRHYYLLNGYKKRLDTDDS